MNRESIARRFGAASGYDTAASVQRLTARRLAARLAAQLAVARTEAPRRILEFGCGTGALTAELRILWPDAEIIATDIAPEMLERAQSRLGDAVSFQVMDAARPEGVEGRFDLICGNLALQWIEDRAAALAGLAGLLCPGGILGVTTLAEGSFAEWRAAHGALSAGTPDYPSVAQLSLDWPRGGNGAWHVETVLECTGSGLEFMRGLRRIGADMPRAGAKPLSPGQMRRVLARFDAQGAEIGWQIAFGLFRRSPRAGVFVTGTDTGVGKTFVSACLTRAWNALYWKPLQTGLNEDEGDTPVVARLAGAEAARILPPFAAFQQPLSPEAAAAAEGKTVDARAIVLPMAEPERPLVVEGAGGVMVPISPGVMVGDVIAALGLPVVLVARSGLGTLNHTLLSIAALRERGIAIAGVVLNGPSNPGNREGIERHGRVRVLAEILPQAHADAAAVERIAPMMPGWSEIA